MFTKFWNPLHQLAQKSLIDRKKLLTETVKTKRKKHRVIFGLLAICLLGIGSGKYFLKNESIRNVTVTSISDNPNMEFPTSSVTTYVNFDKRKIYNENRSGKTFSIETPHIDKTIKGNIEDGKVRGYIRDENAHPVKSADILLYRANDLIAVTYSALNGEFIFDNIEPGLYTIKVLRMGYKELVYPEFEIGSGNTSRLDISIETLAYEVCKITAKGREQKKMLQCDRTTSTSLTRKNLTKTGTRGNRSKAKASVVPKLKGGVSGRGSRTRSTAYFVDGVRVFGGSSSNLQACKSIKKGNYATRIARGIKYSISRIFHRKPKLLYQPEPYVYNTESYAPLIENEYMNPFNDPLSTFSIDVDNASYTNTRRMILANQLPPKDAVRIEEFINYFDYDYPQPKEEKPFSINLETASCPWNKDTKLVHIGLKGKEIQTKDLPSSNLVFLVDVSGSMQPENRLPLVKRSLKLLVDQMRSHDRIAIVTYAGAAGLALESISCSEKQSIKDAIDNLDAGGSTAGGQGIELAYKVAKENLKPDGNNRIILVTDGDFNVGISGDGELRRLIEGKRKDGIYLTVCGFGMGNYKDSKLETLADYGNGNYYYIDDFKESIKVFSKGLTGTLFTIAKDVKIQVEFNPAFVKAYRLIGYENRLLEAQDFANDAKDAGELGAGHTVTALYEIIPAGSNAVVPGFIELKYQGANNTVKDFGNEMLTIKLRYKKPDEEVSHLLVETLISNTKSFEEAGDNFRYACGVVVYGMMLRDSKFKATASYDMARSLLMSAKLNEENGYKAELLDMIDKAKLLSLPK